MSYGTRRIGTRAYGGGAPVDVGFWGTPWVRSSSDTAGVTDAVTEHHGRWFPRASADTAGATDALTSVHTIKKMSGYAYWYFDSYTTLDFTTLSPLVAYNRDLTQGAVWKFTARGVLTVPPIAMLPPEPFNWHVVTTSTVSVGATSIAVEPIGVSIPTNAHLYGPTSTEFILSAPANSHDTSVSVYPLIVNIPSGTVLTGQAPAPPAPPLGSPPAPPQPGTEESIFVPVRRLTIAMPPPTLNGDGQPI